MIVTLPLVAAGEWGMAMTLSALTQLKCSVRPTTTARVPQQLHNFAVLSLPEVSIVEPTAQNG